MPTLSDTEQLTAALEAVTAEGQPHIQPVISDRLDAILASVKLASTWVQNTAYVVGNVIMPTVRNGHKYRCTVAGTSEALLADEVEWPTIASGTITEGASDPLLTWIEDGPELSQIYDIQKAIHQCWMEKAGLASLLADVSQQVGGLRSSQVYDHCIEMAKLHGSLGIA